jgi:integrase
MKDNGRNAVGCPRHPKERATYFVVRFGRQIWKKFSTYDQAARFLTGLRFKTDEGSFDVRDYQASNPLSFRNLANSFLEVKREQVKRHSWDSINNYMQKAVLEWGDRNVKEIGYAELEDFLYKSLKDLSSKSRSNARSVLRSFFGWIARRRVLHQSQLPELPEVPFELSFRKTIEKNTQERIVDELRSISWEVNPRIWIAVKWLATYIAIRPGELIKITEGEINRENGLLLIPSPKEKKPKIIPLLESDVQLISSLPVSFPGLPFFRHLHTHSGARAGDGFGQRYLYKWWKKACGNLGIEGVDLYGGTRHSTVIALGEDFTPEQLKQASFHSTNKAFERYYRVKPEQVLNVYEAATPQQHRGNTLKWPK